MDRLLEDLQYIKGVGPKRSRQLKRLGLDTVFDLLWNIPRAYFNRANVNRITELKDGEAASIRGKICSTGTNRTRSGMTIFKALVEDDSGAITAVWFNQPFMSRIIKPGQEIFLTGKARRFSYSGVEFNVSEYEIIDDEDNQFKVLPIYALTEGLSQKTMRFITLNSLRGYLDDYYPEILDEKLRKKYDLCPIDYAVNNIHFPDSREAYRQARRRLAMEELLLFQLQIRQLERYDPQGNYVIHKEKTALLKRLKTHLPFQLTSAQQKVITEIFTDMESPYPMNRLLQGDVGAGKTVVAALAMAKAVASGFQAAIMAPTEILAQQHYTALEKFFSGYDLTVARLTGGTSGAERRLILEAVKSGEIDLLVGTHALIQDDVVFNCLGLVVIDEQHRFGVRQRAALSDKGSSPDTLVMTATPIPRTLALTVYGDLNLSVINELPPGRKPIKTYFIEQERRQQVYRFIHEQAHNKAQAYIVCPLVEESEKQDLQAAVSLYEELKSRVFPSLSVGLIHGRLKPTEKDMVMQMFKQGKIRILVSTSVIEVGVDVPNASIMVIEQAERFGLSQLHQLRGRVGRGHKQSYCFLIADPRNEEAVRRLQVMEKTNDGFKIAEEDLKIRGPGEFWGVKQHGLDGLKVANLSKDQKLVELSRVLAEEIKQDHMNPQLEKYIALKFKKLNQVAPN